MKNIILLISFILSICFAQTTGGAGSANDVKVPGLLEVAENIKSNNFEFLSDYDGDLETAVSTIGATETTLIVNVQPDSLTGNLTTPITLDLQWNKGYPLVASGVSVPDTLTVDGSFNAGVYQTFDSTLVVNGNFEVDKAMPQWWGALADGSHHDSLAIKRAIDAGDYIYFPSGTYSANIVLSTYQGKTLIGDGYTTIIKAATSDPVITIDGVGHYTINISVRSMLLNGDSTSIGISMTATSINVTSDCIIDDIRIQDVTRGIYINSTTAAEEVYLNKFSNIHISKVIDYGIYQTKGVYNSWENIAIDGLLDTANAIWNGGTANTWDHISTEGRIYTQGVSNEWSNITIETIGGDADAGSIAFQSLGGNTILSNLRFVSVAAKVGKGISLNQYNHLVSGVVFITDTPTIPLNFTAGTTGGCVSNFITTGGHDYTDNTFTQAQLAPFTFINSDSLFSDIRGTRIPSPLFGDARVERKQSAAHWNAIDIANDGNWSGVINYHSNLVFTGSDGIMGGLGTTYDGAYGRMDFHSMYNSGFKDDADIIMSIRGNGTVGIGTIAPVNALNVDGAYNFFVASSGGDDDWNISTTGLEVMTTGMTLFVQIDVVNTDGATLQINALGAKAVHKQHNVALATGDVEVGQILHLVYDGTDWQMLSQIAQ